MSVVVTNQIGVALVVDGAVVGVGASGVEAVAIAVGIQGPAGKDGASVSIDLVAAVSLSGQRAITSNGAGKAIYCDNLTPAHAGKFLGVAQNAALVGDIVHVQTIGLLQDSAFSFTPTGLVYCGANGVLTQTPPAAGFSNVIGYALLADTLFIFEKSIILAE